MITRFLPYTITLEAPALLTAPGGDPNSVTSLGFVPGSSVRGAVARCFMGTGEFERVVLSGEVSFLNAYPVIDGCRTLPTPVTLREEKYDQALHDLAASLATADSWPDEQLVSPTGMFVSLDQPDLVATSASLSATIHQQRFRPMGRAMKAKDGRSRGTIFSYDAVEAGQVFSGALAIRSDGESDIVSTARLIADRLGSHLRVGRSRRAGYGGEARLDWPEDLAGSLQPLETTGTTGVAVGGVNRGQSFRILLTSDFIGRDGRTGQFDPWSVEAVVAEALGGSQSVQCLGRAGGFRLVGGFNRTWGLQIPQALSLRAGSVLVFEALADLPDANLRRFQQTGYGERTIDGFGRLVVLQAADEMPGRFAGLPRQSVTQPSGEVPPLVRLIDSRLVRRAAEVEVEREVTRIAAAASRDIDTVPSTSLLGRLRGALARTDGSGADTLRTWLSTDVRQRHRLRRPAERQLARCIVTHLFRQEEDTLAGWVRSTLDTPVPQEVLNRLQNQRLLRSATDPERRLLDEAWPEWRLATIDRLLALLQQMKRRSHHD